MTEEQKKRLEQKLWDIANVLRGKMHADEFRDYILGFIFYKYLSEKMQNHADKILKPDGFTYIQLDEANDSLGYLTAIREDSLKTLGYFLKPSELFTTLAAKGIPPKDGELDGNASNKTTKAGKAAKDAAENEAQTEKASHFILDELDAVLKNIQRTVMAGDAASDLDNLFEDLDIHSTKLGRTPDARNTVIAKILGHLGQIDFRLADQSADIIGDAYEYLIAQFASGAGKKAGEFYTPAPVSTILARLVTTGRKTLRSVYDPTCGSGSLLLRINKEATVEDYYGQELNRTTYNLARMNMILHGVHYRNFHLKQDDTLEHPQHLDKKFDAIVANPPFSIQWSARDSFNGDDRFAQYGRLAPSSKADFAFIQHMLHHLEDHGTMAVVLPHGVLFRGGAEGHIRQYLIQDRNWLDAVIGLPANIFYGTSIPTCVLVFKKCREHDDILFIDGSNDFEKVKNQNKLRDQDIDRIISTYRGRTAQARYSHKASRDEIAGNDYNLNIPRYVDTFEAQAPIDLAQVAAQLVQLQNESQAIDQRIAAFCLELGIAPPFAVETPTRQAQA